MSDFSAEDYIRWVEWRLLDLEHDQVTSPLSIMDCRIWLAYERDGKSLTEIARQEYPKQWRPGTGKRRNPRLMSAVRRSIAKVERYLNRSGEGHVYPKGWKPPTEAMTLNDVLLASGYAWLGN